MIEIYEGLHATARVLAHDDRSRHSTLSAWNERNVTIRSKRNAAVRLKEASLRRCYIAVIANDKRSAGDREEEKDCGERKGWGEGRKRGEP